MLCNLMGKYHVFSIFQTVNAAVPSQEALGRFHKKCLFLSMALHDGLIELLQFHDGMACSTDILWRKFDVSPSRHGMPSRA